MAQDCPPRKDNTMPYSMTIYDADDSAVVPSVGDMFRVTDVYRNVISWGGERCTGVVLEPVPDKPDPIRGRIVDDVPEM